MKTYFVHDILMIFRKNTKYDLVYIRFDQLENTVINFIQKLNSNVATTPF